jgi:hypothetical protein
MIRVTAEEYLGFLRAYLDHEFKGSEKWHPEDIACQIQVAMDVVTVFVHWLNERDRK